MTRAQKKSAQEWSRLAQEFQDSSLTLDQFAQAMGIKPGTMRTAFRRIGVSAHSLLRVASTDDEPVRMLPVTIKPGAADAPAGSAVQVDLGWATISMPTSMSPSDMGLVLRMLKTAC